MLEIKKLSKYYGKFKAVDDVSFTVPTGQIGILLGPNGAGKSTIIKSIAGLLRYEGTIAVDGIPSRSLEAKKRFAYVPELPALFPALTVVEHLEYIKRAYRSEIIDAELDSLLERFEMSDKKGKLGNELSKGMMQKLSICCALAIKPSVILLDEPMVGLDPVAIKELKKLIMELKSQGVTVLISTHMLEMVKELWDYVFIMKDGKLVGTYANTPEYNGDIERIFFEITGDTQSHDENDTELQQCADSESDGEICNDEKSGEDDMHRTDEEAKL